MTESDDGMPQNSDRRAAASWPIVLGLVAVSPCLLLFALIVPWPWLPALIGRAHPLILHFPIALLLLVAAMEVIEIVSRRRFRFDATLPLFLGTLGAVLAAVCGFLLMRADAVEGDRVERHMWAGLTVAVIAVVALVIQQIVAARGASRLRHGYRLLLLALCGTLLLTGHDGSALTHGEDYLTQYLPWNANQESEVAPTFPTDQPIAQWAAYQHVVAPILQARCNACHNSTNFKGKLVLDKWEGLIRGGKTGALWVQGRPAESLLIERLLLPLEDEKHMPPKKKAQLSQDEIRLLKLWVKAGAPAEGIPATLATDEAWLNGAKKLPTLLAAARLQPATPAEESHEIDPAKVAAARAAVDRLLAPVHKGYPGLIEYESRSSSALRVNASLLAAAFGDADLASLAPLRDSIVEMDLSDTSITDESAPVIASMKRIRRLRLNSTQITDRTVEALSGLVELESLSLFRTGVSDASAAVLAKLPKLGRVYATETNLKSHIASAQAVKPEPMKPAQAN